jgi:hypothetical protein
MRKNRRTFNRNKIEIMKAPHLQAQIIYNGILKKLPYNEDVFFNKKSAISISLITVMKILEFQPYDVYTVDQCYNVRVYWDEVEKELDRIYNSN